MPYSLEFIPLIQDLKKRGLEGSFWIMEEGFFLDVHIYTVS
jgi:hypothetical protein